MCANQKRLTAILQRPFVSAQPARGSGLSSLPSTDRFDLHYLSDLLKDTRGELARVDSKASLLLAAIGVILSTLITGFADVRWTPLDLNVKIQWIWWLGVAAAAFGVFSIAMSVYPRIHQPDIPRSGLPAYYGDVASYQDIGQFRQAIRIMPDSTERLINQTFVLSRMVRRKYVLLRRGLLSLVLAIPACALAVALSAALGR